MPEIDVSDHEETTNDTWLLCVSEAALVSKTVPEAQMEPAGAEHPNPDPEMVTLVDSPAGQIDGSIQSIYGVDDGVISTPVLSVKLVGPVTVSV